MASIVHLHPGTIIAAVIYWEGLGVGFLSLSLFHSRENLFSLGLTRVTLLFPLHLSRVPRGERSAASIFMNLLTCVMCDPFLSELGFKALAGVLQFL
jgi:hypothetical protein